MDMRLRRPISRPFRVRFFTSIITQPRWHCDGKPVAEVCQPFTIFPECFMIRASVFKGVLFIPQTIYLADDEKKIRDLIETFLTEEGFAVRTFPDGAALQAACRQSMPDLVILDIMMSGVDGLSLCSQLRQGEAVFAARTGGAGTRCCEGQRKRRPLPALSRSFTSGRSVSRPRSAPPRSVVSRCR